VVMANLFEIRTPAAMKMLGGGVAAAGSEELRTTVAPPGGAGASNVTLLPKVDPPEATETGDRVIAATATGLTVRVWVSVTPPREALIVTGVGEITGDVPMKKFEEVCPPSTVTEAAGLATAGSELVIVT